jgi:hypothetical protein
MILAALGGCSSSAGISTDFKRPPSERADIEERQFTSGPIRIPESAPFNFTSYRSGQTETGQGVTQPAGKNGVSSKVEAKNGGSAWAEFDLGYTFDLVGPRPQAGVVRLRLKSTRTQKLEHPATTSGPSGESSTSSGQLRFVVKDSNGRLLRDENLLAGGGERSPTDVQQSHELAFDVPFEPGLGYYLVIAGRCDVQTISGDSATVTLGINDASLEIGLKGSDSAKASASTVGSSAP